MTGNVTILAPIGVQLSDDRGDTWHSSLTEIPTDGTLASKTIDVRINSTLAGSIASPITNDTIGATTQDVTLGGTVTPAAVSQFILTGLSAGTAGNAQSLTVEAEDQYGNEDRLHRDGHVHQRRPAGRDSRDSYTFTNADGGQHTFTNGVTLKTAGSRRSRPQTRQPLDHRHVD